ncbi:MAG: hypothetical protein ACREL3_01120 [Gemmatimonadales bacterium]
MGDLLLRRKWPSFRVLWPYIAAALFCGAVALLHRELATSTYRGIMRSVADVAPARLGAALAFTILAYATLPG